MSYQVLARKWRPKCLSEVVGQTHVVQALTNALNQQYLHHAYLFTGTRGVGKTTLARIIAKCLNCEKGISAQPCQQCDNCQEIDNGRFPDLFEVDGASRTKVEDTRELLENVPYAPTKGRFKVYLIDEVHMLSGHSFNALLKTLEEPPSHVKFLLATTDHQKLPATILSRCLQFHLSHISIELIVPHLQAILTKENIPLEENAILAIAKAANGSLRDALSLLDQCIAYGNGKVLTAEVKSLLGTVESNFLYEILDALYQKNANYLLSTARKLTEQGADFSKVLSDLLSMLHQIAVLQAVPEATFNEFNEKISLLAKQISREDIQLYYQIGLMGQRDLPFAPTPRSGFEMILLRMLAFTPQQAQNQHSRLKTQSVSNSSILERTSLEQASSAPKALEKAQTTLSWHELLPQLKLQGACLALAELCGLKEITATEMFFILDAKHKTMLQAKYVQQINEAINHYFNKSMKVSVDIGVSTLETPAGFKKRQRDNQQLAAEEAIHNDETIKRLMKTFDAKIIEGSIRPVDV